jgi:hypothetical protein
VKNILRNTSIKKYVKEEKKMSMKCKDCGKDLEVVGVEETVICIWKKGASTALWDIDQYVPSDSFYSPLRCCHCGAIVDSDQLDTMDFARPALYE